jgi:acetylornithine deacetylase/succinyl-diaminopimelate desuccinylase-like protein
MFQPKIKPTESVEPASEIDWAAVEEDAAQLLSRYIQFDTTNPPGNELLAVEFLAELLHQRGFTPHIIRSAPKRANLIVRLKSRAPDPAPPCLLYTHADVVPADLTDWSEPPFAGHIQAGFVWGRGALDNKGLGIIFIQALTLLQQVAADLNRDIILLIAADEETTGKHGVAWLLDHHPELINAEYVWDEGGMGLRQMDRHTYYVAIAEKTVMTINLIAHGTPGHASVLRADNPHDRLIQALFRIKRWQRPKRLTPTVIEMLQTLALNRPFPQSALFARAANPILWPLLRPLLAGDGLFASLICDTITVTILKGGQTSNVVPAHAEACLDIRLLPDQEPATFLAGLRSIIADPRISVELEDAPPLQLPTSSNTPFYRALVETLRAIDPAGQVTPYLTPGATDSRFFRAAGMKAYGFMPMQLAQEELSRIHGVDERVSTANLRWGTRVVFETLQRL